MDTIIRTKIDTKYIKAKATVDYDITSADRNGSYVYKVNCNSISYILKGRKINLGILGTTDKANKPKIKDSLSQLNEIYQEYFFTKTICVFSPHFVKPLFLDYEVQLAAKKDECSYLYIEVLFEEIGIFLEELYDLETVKIEQSFDLMRQAANGLALLHNTGKEHFNINPTSMVYDKENGTLKIADNTFSQPKKKSTNSTVTLNGKTKAITLEYSPPEVLKDTKLTTNAIDVYCWAASFYSLMLKRDLDELRGDNAKYKMKGEEVYKLYVDLVKMSFDSIDTKNYTQTSLKNFVRKIISKALNYEVINRPKIQEIEKEITHFNATDNHSKELINLLMLNTKVMMHKNCENCKNKILKKVELDCGHTICKHCLVEYALKKFLDKEPYEYSYQCSVCEKRIRLRSVELDCGCVMEEFGPKARFIHWAKSEDDTIIDISLKDDYTSFLRTSLMLDEYLKRRNNPLLRTMYRTKLRRETIENITESLKSTTIIRKLNLQKKELLDSGAQLLSEVLTANETIIELDIQENRIYKEGMKAICGILKQNRTLAKLNIKSNPIMNESVIVLADALKVNKKLKSLNTNNNYVYDEACTTLSNGLKYNNGLTHLFMNHNYIAYAGTKALGETLKVNKTLLYLSISNNKVGSEGAIFIAEALKTNKALKELEMANNSIKDKGIKYIAETLKVNKVLKELDVAGNSITDESAEDIAKAIRRNKSLVILILWENSLKSEGKAILKEVRKYNKIIRLIY